HTRFSRDWSSDVCSSDLGDRAGALRHARIHAQLLEQEFGTPPDPAVVALAERLRGEPAAAATTAAPAHETPPAAEPPAARVVDEIGRASGRESADITVGA